MAKTPADNERNAARNQNRTPRLLDEASSKPALKLVDDASDGGSVGKSEAMAVRTRDLIDLVAASTGGKKSDLRAIIEATLEAIGTTLATGKALNVPPLGKLRVAKNKPPVMTLKLRLADGPKAAGLALADEDEDS